jgi:hypothetical protein
MPAIRNALTGTIALAAAFSIFASTMAWAQGRGGGPKDGPGASGATQCTGDQVLQGDGGCVDLPTDTLGDLTCTSGQIAKFNGTTWACAADDDTDTSAADCGPDEVLTGDDECVDLAELICEVVGNVGACDRSRTVFITSEGWEGDLGGVAGADLKCQTAAVADGNVVPTGEYLAWISDLDGNSPSTNFVQSDAPYIRPDGTKVADDYADLTDGALLAGIFVDEFGSVRGATSVWTGTAADGTAIEGAAEDVNCVGWTSDVLLDAAAVVGINISTGGSWTNGTQSFCSDLVGSLRPIYCFQQ